MAEEAANIGGGGEQDASQSTAYDVSNSWPGMKTPEAAPVTAAEETAAQATGEQVEGAPAGEQQPDAEPVINEQTEPKVVLSSYQRLKQSSDAAITEATAKTTELETKLAEIETTPAIRADKPSDEWDANQALETFPEAHRDKLITAMMDNALVPIAQVVASNPEQYPDDYKNLTIALTPVAETCYQRPIGEINQIMTMVQGVSVQQLDGLLRGENVTIGGGYQGQPQYQGGNLPVNSPLYVEAAKSGLDLEDEAVNGFLSKTHGALTYSQQEITKLQNSNQALEARLQKLETGQSTQSAASLQATIDRSVAASRTAAYEFALKDPATGQSRIPAGDTQAATLIKAAAEFDLQNSPLNTHIAAALKWQKDGMKAASDRALQLADDVIRKAYAKATTDVIGRGTTQAAPPPPNPRLIGGSQVAATGSTAAILANSGPIGNDESKVRALIAELERAAR